MFNVLGVSLCLATAFGGVTTDAPGWTFVETECPAFACTSVSSDVRWTLYDWRGAVQKNGVWPVDGHLTIEPLAAGYYKVVSTCTDGVTPKPFTFCVTRRDPCRDADSFFAVDAAFTSISRRGSYDCPWYDGDTLRVTAELLGKCGVTHTRERNSWGRMEPTPGKYCFDTYLKSAQLLTRNGVRAFGLISDTPRWMRRPNRSLPGDLVATYRFMRAAAAAFEPYYDAWEFWNEPNLSSTVEPVWEYVAALKAATLGVRDGSATSIVLPGSLSHIDSDGYARVMVQSDMPKYAQALNIHTYTPPRGLAAWHKRVHNFLASCGVPDWQVWMTESGTDLEGLGRLPSVRKGLKAHDAEQEMVVAEFAVKSAILQRFNGTFRNWFFLFGTYNERRGEKDWGSMRRDGSVKPVHAALSAISGELGSADQLGRVDVAKDVFAYLYARKDGRRTLVIWNASPVDSLSSSVLGKTNLYARTVDLPLGDAAFSRVDMMGRRTEIVGTKGRLRLAIDRYPQYLTGAIDLPVATAARATGICERYTPRADEDLTVVIRPELDTNDFSIVGKSRAELNKATGRMRLEVWNLANDAKRGVISFSHGTTQEPLSPLDLPANGKCVVDVAWTPPQGVLVFDLDIAGVFAGKRISRTRIPINCSYLFMRTCKTVALDRLNKPESWRRNDSADRYACCWDESEKAVRFDVSWQGEKDRWFYPVFELARPEEGLSGARYVEFEVKSRQDKVENDFSTNLLMLAGDMPGSEWLSYAAPTFTWERRRVLLPATAASAKRIRIGGNPKGRRLTFWVRNVKLLKDTSAQ